MPFSHFGFVVFLTVSVFMVTNVGSALSMKDQYRYSKEEILNFLKNDLNINKILKTLEKNSTSQNVANPCIKSMLGMNQQVLFKAIDSSFKPAAGVLAGNVAWLGNYRECMKTDGLHFCTMSDILLAEKLPLSLGMCIPEQCGTKDVLDLIKVLSQDTKIGNFSLIQIYVNARQMSFYGADHACYSKEIKYSAGAIVMLTITLLIAALCLIGSITEGIKDHSSNSQQSGYKKVMVNANDNNGIKKSSLILQNDESVAKEDENNEVSMHKVTANISKDYFIVKFLLCFSLIKNTKSIFNTDIPAGAITALNGMRFLSITWVILGHCVVFSVDYISDTPVIYSYLKRFSFQAILNASVSVDSFFFLSGLLVGYLSLKRYEAKGSLPLLRYYVHRYIRLTPSYAYILFIFTYLFPILGNGPYWYNFGPGAAMSQNCEKYWWTNLLYINNFYPDSSKMCCAWSWYLANDMQFYVISPIILYIMYKFRVLGLSLVNGILLLACLITNGALIYHYNLLPVFNGNLNLADPATTKRTMDYQSMVYFYPYTRISPYLVGLVLGYILIHKLTLNGNYTRTMYFIGWFIATGLAVAVMYGPYSQYDYDWKLVDYTIYGTMFRFVWAIALAWVIYACHNGRGGLVNTILSWKAFIPLSRLTYAVYLVHPLVLWCFFATTQVPTDFTITFYVYFFIASTVISFMLAFVITVCIEYPVFNLEKLLLKF